MTLRISSEISKILPSIIENNGFNYYDVAVIFPDNFKGNLLNEVRNRNYWKTQLDELIQIFNSDNSIKEVFILDNPKQLINSKKYINFNKNILKIELKKFVLYFLS